MLKRSPLSLLSLLGLTLFASPVAAQVLDLGPSDPALFDNVITVPAGLGIGDGASFGGDGLLTQLNLVGGSVGDNFDAQSGNEVNISDGIVGSGFDAFTGSEVNISGGTVGPSFLALPGSVANVSGGAIGTDFTVFTGSQLTSAKAS